MSTGMEKLLDFSSMPNYTIQRICGICKKRPRPRRVPLFPAKPVVLRFNGIRGANTSLHFISWKAKRRQKQPQSSSSGERVSGGYARTAGLYPNAAATTDRAANGLEKR